MLKPQMTQRAEQGDGSPPLPPLPPRPHPTRISGTAMVGSVHLSNGVIGTGSSWRLLLTGLTFPLLMLVAAIPAFALTYAAQRLSGRDLIAFWVAGIYEGGSTLEWALWRVFLSVAYLLSFLLVLRLTPLAGYHAAEHKVVNAIEEYGYVTHDLARRMPRAHVRCGTNLLVPIITLFALLPLDGAGLGGLHAAAVLVALLLRVPLGAALQNLATTREPSEKQLREGIEAGRKLLHEWRLNPGAKVTTWQALWRRGLPQMVAGLLLAGVVLNYVQSYYYHWLDW